MKSIWIFLGQLCELDDISYRAMMGEFIVYFRGKKGGTYNNRLLVKPVKSAISYILEAECVLPYAGAKEMLLVDDVDNKDYLADFFNTMCDNLADSKLNKKKWDASNLKR